MCADENRSDSSRSDTCREGECSDPAPTTFYARFEATDDSIVVAIVETVAAATDRDPTDVSPLFTAIDAEALADLLLSARARSQAVEVTFAYEDCRVTVSSFGDVVVELLDR